MKKLFIFLFVCFTGSLLGQTPFYKNIIIQKAAPQLYLNGTGGQVRFYNTTLTESSTVLNLAGGSLTISNVPVLTLSDSTLYYFSLFRGAAVEADLANYDTIPAPTSAPSGYFRGTDGEKDVWLPPPTAGSGGSATSKLQFVVGVTSGAPGAGDSIITHTDFVEKHVEVYRGVNATQGGGLKQFRNPTGSLQTTSRGYRFDKSTGIIIVKPVLVTNDNIIVEVTDSTTWTDLSFPAVSSLLTGIKTYYKLDEVAGTTLDDATGNKDLTTDATINQTGVIGKAVHLGWKKEISGFAYNAATTLNWSTWTVKLWVKLDSLPTATGRAYTLFSTLHSASPYWNAILRVETDNRLRIRVRNNSSTVIESYGDTLQTVNHWYHIVVRFRGNGYATQIYKAGTESTEAGAGLFSGTLYQVNRGEYWGTASDDDPNTWTSGLVDECGTWGRSWTEGEILQNYNDEKGGKTYPWTP